MYFIIHKKIPLKLWVEFNKFEFLLIPHFQKFYYKNVKKEYGINWDSKINMRIVISFKFSWLNLKFELLIQIK